MRSSCTCKKCSDFEKIKGKDRPLYGQRGNTEMAAPWNKIRAEWLKGGITQKALAEKYGLSEKTIRNRAYKEGWKKQKGQIQDKVEEETRGRIVRARVNHLEKLIEANEALLDGLLAMAGEIKEHPTSNLFDKTRSLRNAESFAKALQTAAMTQRDLYRIPNIDQRFAAKKWREQLKLEKEKAKGPESSTGPLMMIIHEPGAEGGEPDE